MRVLWFSNVEAFYARVAPYLLPREAEHNLTLGLLGTIRHFPARYPDAIYALVEADDGAVQLVAIKTNPERNLILSLAQSPAAIASLADELHARGLPLPGVTAPNDESVAFAGAWAARTGQVAHLDTPMRTFKLDAVTPITGVPGHMRRPLGEDRALIIEWELAFRAEAFPELTPNPEESARAVDFRLNSDIAGIFLWDDGGAVSYVGYGGPTPHGIRIGPVYTPPEHRKRGYASACVAQLSQHLLNTGHEFCFLFTDLRNPTSNHIYQQIGYRAVCDFNEYRFLER
jgi:GNAT superfamily N-acetyltransferase